MIDAADEVLQTVAEIRVTTLALSVHPVALRKLEGHGVTMLPVEPSACGEETVMYLAKPDDDLRVRVDIASVLRDALTPHGLTVGKLSGDGSFLPLLGHIVPSGARCYFALNNDAPLYAVRALAQGNACIVFHVNPYIGPEDANVLRTMGVHPVRLRDIESLTPATLKAVVDEVKATRDAAAAICGGEPLDGAHAETLRQDCATADPSKVVEYATTGADRAFESAVSKIISPLFDRLFPLGSRLTGRPFPDGLVLREASQEVPVEVATYDCKSTRSRPYALVPEDGDQQIRYLAIQERLREDHGWRPRGVVLFVSEVDRDTFFAQIEKDFWRQITRERRRLLVIPAESLARWHSLLEAEQPGAIGRFFARKRFWEALFDGCLPGVSDHVCGTLVPERGSNARVLGMQDAELVWAAGMSGGLSGSRPDTVARALSAADPEGMPVVSVARPTFIQAYFRALRGHKVSLESLQRATGLGERAIRYMLMCSFFFPAGPVEAGERGFANLNRIRREIGAGPVTAQ